MTGGKNLAGRIAVEKGFAAPKQVEACVRLQDQGRGDSLLSLLAKVGSLSREQVEELARAEDSARVPWPDGERAEFETRLFVTAGVQRKLLRWGDWQMAMRLHAQEQAAGKTVPFDRYVVAAGFLTASQAQSLLPAREEEVLTCSLCRRQARAASFVRERRAPLCERCGGDLAPRDLPSPVHSAPTVVILQNPAPAGGGPPEPRDPATLHLSTMKALLDSTDAPNDRGEPAAPSIHRAPTEEISLEALGDVERGNTLGHPVLPEGSPGVSAAPGGPEAGAGSLPPAQPGEAGPATPAPASASPTAQTMWGFAPEAPGGAGAPTPPPAPDGEGGGSEAFGESLVGKELGGCKITRLIGKGGMGVVFAAVHTLLQRPCAVKVLPQSSGLTREMIARFFTEARALAQIDHPNIVRIFNVGTDSGLNFIEMEFMGGGDLADVLERKGNLALREALPIMRQICSGLAAAHAEGIIHRDIKPGNILIGGKGEYKIADFGLAIKLETSARMTLQGTLVGTPYFMSPEQCTGSMVDKYSDVYALGAMFYLMLTGKHAFDAPNPMHILVAHISQRAPSPRESVPDLPPAYSAVIERMMALNPAERYADAGEVLRALEGIEREEAAARRSRKRRRLWEAGVLLVLLLAAGAFLGRETLREWLSGPGTGPSPAGFGLPSVPAALPRADLRVLEPRDGDFLKSGQVFLKGTCDPKVVRKVTVGGETVPLAENGGFQASLALPEGEASVRVAARGAGETLEERTVQFTVDATPPTLELRGFETEAFRMVGTRGFAFEGRLADAYPWIVRVGGISCPLSADGGFRLDVPLREGENRILFQGQDRAGNESSREIRIVMDATPPEIRLDPYEAEVVGSRSFLDLSGRVAEEHPDALLLEGRPVRLVEGAFECRIDLKEGENRFVLSASDLVGLRAEKAVVVRYRWIPEGLRRGARAGEFVWEKDGAVMVDVPGGTFRMGADDGKADEKPSGPRLVSWFFMDKFEVANARYRAFLEWTRAAREPHGFCHPAEPGGKDHTPADWRNPEWNAPEQPVLGIDWFDALAYARWAGKDLPTEAEWEKAAAWDPVAGAAREYPWGSEAPERSRANFSGAFNGSCSVGKFEGDRSAFGAMDLAGNVREWCLDWYRKDAYALAAEFPADPANEAPGGASARVLRGGAWIDEGEDLRAAARGFFVPGGRARTIGFRCVLRAERE